MLNFTRRASRAATPVPVRPIDWSKARQPSVSIHDPSFKLWKQKRRGRKS